MNADNNGQHKGDWGRLQGKSLTDLGGEDSLLSLRGIVGLGMGTRMNNINRAMERIRRRHQMEFNMRLAEVDVAWPRREEGQQHQRVVQDFR